MTHKCLQLIVLTLFLNSLSYSGSIDKFQKAVRTSGAIVIDGFDQDPAWKTAEPFFDFLQREPLQGLQPTMRTEVKILYDDEALYIHCMMFDDEPSKIVGRLARRDDEVKSDYISFRFDSFHDHLTCAEFTVNAAGVKTDILQYDDGNKEDASWDPVWDARTQLLSNGWSAEIKIPFRILRFNDDDTTWGMNIVRIIPRINERDYWAYVSKKENGIISRYGHLTGLTGIRSRLPFEVLPYTRVSAEFLPQNDWRARTNALHPTVGADIKYGLSSNFTADITINPDFGQVEADPAVLNLSTYETYYPEKRPFFVEGTQIFNFTTFGGETGPGLFYSRRIGSAIHVAPPDGNLVTDHPGNASIVGAAKITGKTNGGLAIGILEAVTQRESFSHRDTAGARFTDPAEPAASYSVVRLKQDFWENSNVGVIATGVARRGRMPAFTTGADWSLSFNDLEYVVSGFLAGSMTTDPSSLQKKDGSAGKLYLGKNGGEHWRYNASADFTSKKYYINDMGYFRRPNDYGFFGNLKYKEDDPGDLLRSYAANYSHHLRWNFDRATLNRSGTLSLSGTFMNYYSTVFQGSYSLPASDDRESRGFGLFATPLRYQFNLAAETDDRADIIVGADLKHIRDDNGRLTWEGGVEVLLRASSAAEVEFSLAGARTTNETAWADIAADRNGVDRSVFGSRDITEFEMTVRGSLVFTHDLTLQAYTQFFFAKGQYDEFRYLERSSDLLPFDYSGQADFNETSLQSNVVLRWEYLPGSTLFAVWSHSRSFEEGGGYRRTFTDEWDRTFLVPPDNIFMLKISYLLSGR